MANDDCCSEADTPENISYSQQNNSFVSFNRRACEACRARKIRCDRISPCSHCVQAKIPCTQANPQPKAKRTRILLSTQYERKIDRIDHRLEGVTQLLQNLKTSLLDSGAQPVRNSQSPGSTVESLVTATSSRPFGCVVKSASDSPVGDTEPSLAAHSVFANEFLQNAVRAGCAQDSSLEMRGALDSLHHIVDSLKQQITATPMSYPNAKPTAPFSLRDCELPPIEKAVAFIRIAKAVLSAHPSDTLPWIRDFSPLAYFSDLCLSVYFSEDFSEADFIIVNMGLLYLLLEHSHRVPDNTEETLSFVALCRKNLETALSNLPLHLPATSTTISALLLGAFYAVEISKPSLSWTLASKASELCQTAGFHRLSSMKDDVPSVVRHKKMIFWSVYSIDKSLSLRLGRASTIPDWDVTVPPPTTEDFATSPLVPSVCLWIMTARCQGNIYEMLYCPSALVQPDHVRRSRVEALASELREIRKKAAENHPEWMGKGSKTGNGGLVNFVVVSDDVLRLSLLTLVYRASPLPEESSTPFTPECIEAARITLQRHQDCMEVIENVHSLYFPVYVSWTLLFAPFIPFIVLFCQVIETKDEMDLDRLHSFIVSMESAPAVSDAALKMLWLFQVLYNVALRYIEFRTSTPPTAQAQANIELNTYIAALGLPLSFDNRHQPSTELGQVQDAGSGLVTSDSSMLDITQGQRGVDQRTWMDNPAQLEEWFNSNDQMMELVEEPTFSFPLQDQ